MKIKKIFLFLFVFALIACLVSCHTDDGEKWTSNGDGTHSRPSASDPSKMETEECVASGECTGTRVCEVCGGSFVRHEFREVVDEKYLKKEATCTLQAVYYQSCACGETKGTFKSGEPIAHDFSKKASTSKNLAAEGTCSAPALYYYTCTMCGEHGTETYEGKVSPSNHDFGDWTYSGNGQHTRVCANDPKHTETAACSGGMATAAKGAICSVCGGEYTKPVKKINILAIGNSFSNDSMNYLYGMLADAGYTEIHLANLYIGGCSLETHATNAMNDTPAYTYFYNDDGEWKQTERYRISDALALRAWDVVTMQQNSGDSGHPATFEPHLENLLTYVRARVSDGTKFYWNMTWAYKPEGSLGGYGNSQDQMYRDICSAVTSMIVTNNNFAGFIPVGTAIQNVRTSSIGQNVCRDENSHLNYDIGRYTAALTWCARLTGCDVDEIDYVPTGFGITDEMVAIAREAVKNAISTPLSVTNSTHVAPIDNSDAAIVKAAGYDLTGYELYDWHVNENSYWNSTASATMTTETSSTAGNFGRFVCSDKLSVATLPAGTVFVLDSGYAVRIEKFSDATSKYSGTRPASSATTVQVLTSDFLADAQYVTFNLSKSNSTQLGDFAEAATHLRVYVKK